MQAMERKSGIEPEITREMTRWLIAEVPGWVQGTGGVLVAVGTAAFAWLVASALGSSRPDGDSRRSARPTDIRKRR